MKSLARAIIVVYAIMVLPVGVFATSAANAPVLQTPSKQHTNLLFVLTADKGTIKAIPEQPGRFRLVLQGVRAKTVYFSDRPKRIAGQMMTKKLVTQWHNGGTFQKSPPNAAIHAEAMTVNKKTVPKQVVDYTVALTNPQYNADSKQLSFDIKALPGGLQLPAQTKTEHVALFIDSWCPGCAVAP